MEDKTNIDKKVLEEWENLKEWLGKQIAKEKRYKEVDPYISEMPEWMEDLMAKVNQTYKINNGAWINFNNYFRAEVISVYNQVFGSTGLGQYFDMLSLKITDKSGASKYYANNYIDSSCLSAAIMLPNMGIDANCKSSTNLMQL